MSSALWNRRTTPGKLTLSVSNSDGNSNNPDSSTPSSARGFGSGKGRGAASRDGNGRYDPLSAVPLSAGGSFNTLASPSTAFSLGSGAFASFGAMKTPTKPTGDPIASAGVSKEPQGPTPSSGAVTPGITGPTFASAAAAANQKKAPAELTKTPLRHTWVVWYRAPGAKFQDYEKSTQKIAAFSTVEEFWTVYSHLRKPRSLPHVSDYHLFKQGIRPVWEDTENKKGGKWIIRLKKGISTRYWEDLILAIIGDQFGESGEDICGAVLSIRNAEDVLSVWTRVNNATTLKIRETIKRVLNFPPETVIIFKTHDESIAHERSVHQGQGQNPAQGQTHRQPNQYGKQDRQQNKNPHHQNSNNSNYHQQSYTAERRD
ncbi:Eukaryotic translation initiation factor [Drechslerella dactyloides]|uniref:Eukaryotic translation initiation factor n=1 Tax=Drechslerella dactyloides TaxID=74499 RepID=A0AAD6IQH0_DREDA|nr:Eukaryotic translation initiation factor [Drechslerella dactyloides]